MRFSRIAVLSALAAGLITLAGCNCGECEAKKEDTKAAAGMVGAKEGCKEAGDACCKKGEKASMGAVSEKKACCKGDAAKCNDPATKN